MTSTGVVSAAPASAVAQLTSWRGGTSAPERYASCTSITNPDGGVPVSRPDRKSPTSAAMSPAPTCVFHVTTANDPVRISERCWLLIRAGGPTPAHHRSIALRSRCGETRTQRTSLPARAAHVASTSPDVGAALPTDSSAMTSATESSPHMSGLWLVRDLYCGDPCIVCELCFLPWWSRLRGPPRAAVPRQHRPLSRRRHLPAAR